MAASVYHVISKEVESHIFRGNCSGIIIFLCNYYINTSDVLVDSFLDVLFLLLAVVLSELHKKPRVNKD